MNRTLTITFNPDWEHSLREAGALAQRGMECGHYQGDYMNYAVPSMFFGRLTAHRWDIVACLLGQGTVGVRELARRLGREVKRVHEDTKVLVDLGLLEKTDRGALRCPYAHIHIDMPATASGWQTRLNRPPSSTFPAPACAAGG